MIPNSFIAPHFLGHLSVRHCKNICSKYKPTFLQLFAQPQNVGFCTVQLLPLDIPYLLFNIPSERLYGSFMWINKTLIKHSKMSMANSFTE